MKYRLIDYFDVWGNAKEGYEVNNLCTFAIVDFRNYPPTDTDILKKLKSIGYLKKTCRLASIVDTGLGDADFIDYEDRKGRPVFRLERVYE